MLCLTKIHDWLNGRLVDDHSSWFRQVGAGWSVIWRHLDPDRTTSTDGSSTFFFFEMNRPILAPCSPSPSPFGLEGAPHNLACFPPGALDAGGSWYGGIALLRSNSISQSIENEEASSFDDASPLHSHWRVTPRKDPSPLCRGMTGRDGDKILLKLQRTSPGAAVFVG